MNYIFVLRGDNVKDLSNKNVIHVKDNDIELSSVLILIKILLKDNNK